MPKHRQKDDRKMDDKICHGNPTYLFAIYFYAKNNPSSPYLYGLVSAVIVDKIKKVE
jgi:hypothetical protein